MTKRILIVDDQVLIAMTAVEMVEALGYGAVEAHSGPEALEILASEKSLDLLTADQSMPCMSRAAEARLMKPDLATMVRPDIPMFLKGGTADVQLFSNPYSEAELSSRVDRDFG